MENIKEFKIINTYEEFKKHFIDTREYLQRESTESQEKSCKYFYKKVILLITKDGYILELDNNPSINKTLWYDDETPTPAKTEQYFLNYNISINLPYKNIKAYLEEKEKIQKNGCATGSYDYNGIYLTSGYTNPKRVSLSVLTDKRYFVRYMTLEEQNELIEIIKDLQNKYIERLKKYYKRYSKNICISGYWANR